MATQQDPSTQSPKPPDPSQTSMPPPPLPASTNTHAIQTYHCLCSNLVLATTHAFPTLPRRRAPALDKAYILPCATNTSDSDSDSEGEGDDVASGARKSAQGYTLLLSVTLQPPLLVRREDGFEKRWLVRCGRCRLVVGYRLDWSQFADGTQGHHSGRRDDVLYVLPGSVMTTEDMKRGKVVEDAEFGFGLV